MNKYDYQKAIKFFSDEMHYLKLMPEVHSCKAKKEWQEQIDIYDTIIDACKVATILDNANYAKAISFLKEEIERLKRAPKLNGCEMTEEWQKQLEICKAAVIACRKVSNICTDA